jgi:hypothetical protein
MDGYHSVSVPDEVIAQLALVMAKYNRDSWAGAIETAAAITFERDEAELAQRLAIHQSYWLAISRCCRYSTVKSSL